ncbi:uncharacterized protein LOC135822262 isoform X1 [Sycon ciliatum]|uniref:uncharacterized protein LOC135822262 isoform X1 n=2 Tax=Sycon ciliatum TaxID=27933 RepID=UPI0031F636D3
MGNDGFGLAYDYTYNTMAEASRTQVRTTIVKATAGKKTCGVNKKPYTCNGNWNTFHLTLCTMALAIEGEEGYDPEILNQSITVMKNFLDYGLHASGAPFEPFGKGAVQSQHMHAMAKRGAVESTVLHPNYLACVRNYYLHAMQPFGYGYAWFEEWGGTGSAGRIMDVIVAKYALPDDKTIDFVWRNSIRDSYYDTIFPTDEAWSAFYGVMDWYSAIVLSQDWTGALDWDTAVADLNAPLAYFCSERGVMMAHSHWAKNATWLEFNIRSDYWSGGHDHPDRGHFNFAIHGRMWGIYPTIAGQSTTPPFLDGDGAQSRHKSVLLVDGLGHGGVVAPPGKAEKYIDSEVATFAVANLTYAYTYSWFLDNWKDAEGHVVCSHYIPAEPETNTVNEFQLNKGNDTWLTTPIWQLADGIRPLFDGDLPQNMCRTLYNPMKLFYYRTVSWSGAKPMLQRQCCSGTQ